MLDGVRLDETSPATVAVAVTSWHDQLYLAWTGSDMHVNLASSADGRAITGKQRTAHRSCMTFGTQITGARTYPLAPALAVSGERLYLAWLSDEVFNLLAAEHAADAAPVTFEEPSANSPSLTTVGNDNLMLAWSGRGGHVNLLTLAADSSGMPVPLEGSETRFEKAKSSHAPALCSHQGSLVLAWTGGDRHINILTGAEDPYGAPTQLKQAKSSHAPALCSHQGSLVLAWTGTDHHINILTDAEDPHGAPAQLEQVKSSSAPALCSHQGSLVLAWTGTDHHINVARLR
jgi:hypothetical protein